MKPILITLCFFAIGVGIAYSGISDLLLDNRTKSWPTTEGRINSSKCVRYYDWSVVNSNSSYFTHVDYTYAVEGQSYKGDRIAFGYSGSWWQRPNQKIADKLSSAKTVLVRYNPDKPSMAVLCYGMNGDTVMTLFGGCWLMLVTAVIIFHIRQSQSINGMIALSWGSSRLKIITQGVVGIVLLVVIGLIILWLLGLLSDCGILSTMVTTG